MAPLHDHSSGQRDRADEQTPLLHQTSSPQDEESGTSTPVYISFDETDEEDPRKWPKRRKMLNVAIIALMAILSPLASSMFTPGIEEIAKSLDTSVNSVVGATTGFVVMLGVGPLVLAPLSETFGRRRLYTVCFGIFSLMQIPTALSPNLPFLIVFRMFAGFFGSVGIANGGGTISDMFVPSERAGVFGWYLLGPLLGPSIGPLLGGIVVQYLHWRWIFGILAIVCTVNTGLGIFFLKETYAPAILSARCERLESQTGKPHTFEGRDTRPLLTKLLMNSKRPLKILFTQPIVFTMALWQAIIFASMYSLFTNMSQMYGPSSPYNLSTLQIGLLYLGPGLGFFLAVWFLVPQIDHVFNALSARNSGKQKPEYRLPLALVGSALLPLSLFWFGWTVRRTHLLVSIAATVAFGFGQVAIFNTCQNYYIDAFQKYAASAIAAGAVFRSIVGGVVPLFAGPLFERLGYGWGWSVFGFLSLVLSPAPLVFMRFGERIREKFEVEL